MSGAGHGKAHGRPAEGACGDIEGTKCRKAKCMDSLHCGRVTSSCSRLLHQQRSLSGQSVHQHSIASCKPLKKMSWPAGLSGMPQASPCTTTPFSDLGYGGDSPPHIVQAQQENVQPVQQDGALQGRHRGKGASSTCGDGRPLPPQ